MSDDLLRQAEIHGHCDKPDCIPCNLIRDLATRLARCEGLLHETRDYVDAEVKAKEAAHGDRIKYKRAGDIDLRARIDAYFAEVS